MDEGGVRNLDQIQEDDRESQTPRAVTLTLLAIGGACAIFAGYALPGRKAATTKPVDPLGDLVAQRAKSGPAAAPAPTDLSPHDVTFPGILSDADKTTTALAAVRANPASSGSAALLAQPTPPPATDRLRVVPLPAQNVLEASPIVTRPRDPLTKAATDTSAAQAQPAAPAAGAGHEGGYQLQVSSFRSRDEADGFANELRTRGHKAYVLEAQVPGRGTWYRVRVGPFATQHAASTYRSSFEVREHVVPFIIPPPGKDGERPASARER